MGSSLTANAQINSQKLLVRDSLDYKQIQLGINSANNEFSPVPYKGGLLFISNKSIQNSNLNFNKVYWVADSNISKLDSNKNVAKTKLLLKNNDDFTPPTSNDNNILFNNKNIKSSSNKIESDFAGFTTNQAFAYNDSIHLLVYAKMSSKKINNKKHWELWQANLINGKLKHNKLINFEDVDADYLYPYLNDSLNKLYFSSNKKGGLGGYDLYYVNKVGDDWDSHPIALNTANTDADEIAAALSNDTLFYSSNRQGGLGGFDIYAQLLSTSNKSENLGYPINTSNDELGLKKISNKYYLTTNRNGNFDIYSLNFAPVFYPIDVTLKYAVDGTLASHQQIIVKDVDAGRMIDTLKTDDLSGFHFIGKPNRNYAFFTKDADGLVQSFSLATNDKITKSDFALNISGRSPKVIRDSVQAVWAKAEAIKLDSIAKFNLNNKFVVHYGFNKSKFQSKENLVLDSLLNKLTNLPNTYIVIGGFTDCIGSYKVNYKVSVKRSKAVVAYLINHGLDKSRIVSNGYSKKYGIVPCTTKFTSNKKLQQGNRRAEIVLSETKQTNWALLEKQRTASYYAVYNANGAVVTKFIAPVVAKVVVKPTVKKDTVAIAKFIAPIIVKKDTIAKVVVKPIVKKDTVAVAKFIAPVIVKKDTIAKVVVKPTIKKDTVAVTRFTAPVIIKKDTVAKVIVKPTIKKDTVAVTKFIAPVIVKKDTIAKVVVKPIVKKDTVAIAKFSAPVIVKKDTVAKVIVKPTVKKDTVTIAKFTAPVIVKKDTVAKVIVKSVVKVDSLSTAKVNANTKKQKDTVKVNAPKVIIAKASEMKEDDEITKEEIIKALDSLAKLKREQERIVEYLTKRINKKPIDVFVSSDSVSIELYDNGIHDKDSVSVIYNNRIVVDREELKVNKPIKFMLKVDKNKKNNELVLVAENLGSEPPNTAVMFITEKSGKRQQVMLSTDMTHNEVVYFIRIAKE